MQAGGSLYCFIGDGKLGVLRRIGQTRHGMTLEHGKRRTERLHDGGNTSLVAGIFYLGCLQP